MSHPESRLNGSQRSSRYLWESLIISQSLVAFNLITYILSILGKTGEERSNFLLYQACIAPEHDFSVIFVSVMPINQVLLYSADCVIILGNGYLYRFLQTMTDKRAGK